MAKQSQKKQAKDERRARREEARRRERRRNLATLGIVGVVVLAGAGLVGLTLLQERRAADEQVAEAEAAQSELAASEEALAQQLADRSVACAAEVPAAATVSDAASPAAAPSPRPSPDTVIEEGVDYAAVIATSCGTVRLDLAEDAAPQAVNSFVVLARDGFYDGLEIFRNATTIGALQTGAGTNDPTFDIGYTVPDELELAQEEGYPPGAVALANSGQPDSSGSQFFFVYDDSFDEAFADNRTYTVFAMVTEGLDVLTEIGAIEVIGGNEATGQPAETPAEAVYIESVEIVEQ